MPVEMYDDFALMQPTMIAPWILALCFALFGACIGSFLNVVIYRVPRGLGVNEPRRSFCPTCKAPIPWYLNLPIISWLLLGGRSACCHTRIPVRYWLVELGTTLLFGAIAWWFHYESIPVIILLCIWGSLMLAMLCIDWELMVVQPFLAVAAAVAGLAAAVLAPWLLDVEVKAGEAADGLMWSGIGAVFGFALLTLVRLIGRLLFGRKNRVFGKEVAWSLRQKDSEDLELTLGEEKLLWSEVFMEDSNRLTLVGATLADEEEAKKGDLVFTVDSVTLPDGTVIPLEERESLSGTCEAATARKEAMGSGDAWIALAIGALCGWHGVLFALVAGSVFGILWAIIAKIGRGKPMPFGPAFIAGAFVWLFCGAPLLVWYWNLIEG